MLTKTKPRYIDPHGYAGEYWRKVHKYYHGDWVPYITLIYRDGSTREWLASELIKA